MGVSTILWLLLATSISAIEVNVTSEWKPDLGWKVMCNWQTLDNDTLQSVRLYNNGQQFMIYRPEKHGPARNEIFRAPEKIINVNCGLVRDRGQEGYCNLILEPFQPPMGDFTYSCEVSGERPMFRIGRKDLVVKILVPPSEAKVVSQMQDETLPSRVMLNCSSTGLPAPNLQWTVADDKLEADFTGRVWNATTKLWKVWSYLSYTRIDESKVLCKPEVIYNGELVRGKSAEFNSAERLFGISDFLLSLCVAITLSLVR